MPRTAVNEAPVIDVLPEPIALWQPPEWLEACEKLGHDPREWANSRLSAPALDLEEHRRLMDAFDEEISERRAQYDAGMDWQLAIIAYNPERVRRALADEECQEYCCG